jgi:hypothetical protein
MYTTNDATPAGQGEGCNCTEHCCVTCACKNTSSPAHRQPASKAEDRHRARVTAAMRRNAERQRRNVKRVFGRGKR